MSPQQEHPSGNDHIGYRERASELSDVGEEGHGPGESVGGSAQTTDQAQRWLGLPVGENQRQVGWPFRAAWSQPGEANDRSHPQQERRAPPEECPHDSVLRCPTDHQGDHERDYQDVGYVEADGQDEQQARSHRIAIAGEFGSKTIRGQGDIKEQGRRIDLDGRRPGENPVREDDPEAQSRETDRALMNRGKMEHASRRNVPAAHRAETAVKASKLARFSPTAKRGR